MHKKYQERANKAVENDISKTTERAIQSVLKAERERPVTELYHKLADVVENLDLAGSHYFTCCMDRYYSDGISFLDVKGENVKKILYLFHAEGCRPKDHVKLIDEKKFIYKFEYQGFTALMSIQLADTCRKVQVGVTEVPVYEIQCGEGETVDITSLDTDPFDSDEAKAVVAKDDELPF